MRQRVDVDEEDSIVDGQLEEGNAETLFYRAAVW